MVVIAVGFFIFSTNSYNDLQQLNKLKYDVRKINAMAHLINELQQERGLTSGYLASHTDVMKKHLTQQYQIVDDSFATFLNFYDVDAKTLYLQKHEKILALRTNVAHFSTSNIEAFDYYTHLIANLQEHYLKMSTQIEDYKVKNYLQIYTNIAQMKESLGQIRGAFNGIFSLHYTDINLLYRVIHAKGMYDAAEHRFQATAPLELQQKYEDIVTNSKYPWIMQTLKKYTTQVQIKTDIPPKVWWNNATEVINLFYILEKNYFHQIEKYVITKSNKLFNELLINAIILLFITVLIIWLSYTIKNNTIKSIHLLNQYKNVVDRSSIVSKTDKRGIITYVNEQFSNISGFSAKELIGKPHNIVRHEDMPRSAFKEMWKTILSKKPWKGIVKNRKKDGSFYIVEATINPILDANGNIEEFIAVRNDITEVVLLSEEIKHTQKDLIFRMSELTETRSKETGFHVRRVAKYSQILAKHYGLSEEEIEYLTLASPMHDIGKVGIPDTILNKPSKLTCEEWEVMKTHTTIGYNLFKDSDKPLLKASATIAHQHHEKYDGSGYPRGLKGEEIHIYARITALADTFDALNSKRSYKEAWDDERILALLQEESGKHFDPVLVDIFFKHLDEFLSIKEAYKDGSAFMNEEGIL
jgi:PAS domain S-box-containing protein